MKGINFKAFSGNFKSTVLNLSSIVTGMLTFLSILSVQAQSDINLDSTKINLENAPAFTIYKDNYFITGTTIGESPSKFNSDVKFQFSFKLRLQNTPVFWNSYLYLIYTQKSFWDIYQDSSPFAETNYNPGLMLAKPVFKENNLKGMVMLSLEHESNGRDSIYSRSWNYLGIHYSHHFSGKTIAGLKLFIPYGLNDNPDLTDYTGFAEGTFTWNIFEEKLILDILGRKGKGWNTKGSLSTSLSYRPSLKRNLYWTLQWFSGYAESLINYQETTNMLRFGITIKPGFLRIY